MIKLKEMIQNKPRWSAIVLTNQSKQELIGFMRNCIQDGWEIIAHHCTIDPFSPIDSGVGELVTLKVVAIGESDKALAVKVTGYNGKTNNAFPHVTVAINRTGGGKPKDSNSITEWVDINGPLLQGTVQNL